MHVRVCVHLCMCMFMCVEKVNRSEGQSVEWGQVIVEWLYIHVVSQI